MTLVYPQFPRLADIAGGTIDAFNQSFGQSRDRRNEREAGPLFDQAFGQYLAPQQGGLGALAPQQPLQQPGQQPQQNAVQRAPLPGTPGYADHRVNQAHGLQSLIQSESGGRWDAQNNAVGAGGQRGHYGRLQFGHARLADAKRAGVIPANMTPEQFMASPEVQQRVEQWHFADIDREAQKRGLMSYVGQNVGGATITPDGIRNMAHLGGIAGAERYLKSGGRYNPADANGTRLSDYARMGSGGGAQQALESMAVGETMGQAPMQGQQMAQMGMPQGQMPMPDRDTMRQLFANPVTRPLAIQLAQAAMQQHDPMQQLQMQKLMLELQRMQDPRQNLINAGGGQIYDPNSGQWISAPGAGESNVDEFGFPRSGAISQKIRGLVMQGVDPQTAMGIATGRYNVSINPATGERVMIDQAEQQIVPLRQPDYGDGQPEQMAGQPQQPQQQAQSRQLWDMTDDATGVWAGTRSASSNTLGQLPGVLGETFTSDSAVEAGQEFDLFKRDLVRSLSLNPRFPVAEMQRIEDLVPRGAFTAPNTLRKALAALNTELNRIEREMTQALQDPRTPVEQRQADMQTLRGVRAAIERIGMPSVTESTDIDDLLELYGD